MRKACIPHHALAGFCVDRITVRHARKTLLGTLTAARPGYGLEEYSERSSLAVHRYDSKACIPSHGFAGFLLHDFR